MSFSTTEKKEALQWSQGSEKIRNIQSWNIPYRFDKVCLCFWNPSGDIESCQFLAVFTEQSSRFSKAACETNRQWGLRKTKSPTWNREALHSLKMFTAMIFGTFWSPKLEMVWNTYTCSFPDGAPLFASLAKWQLAPLPDPSRLLVARPRCVSTRSRQSEVFHGFCCEHRPKKWCLWSFVVPSGYFTQPWKPWPIEIDGLPTLKMVDLSMANCSS